ncbi:MAG: GNAT family N-acetyltransferase, partial [Hyphomicrobiales bacterium]|nr:GNAT family N-acetyltransferase [Hyphomicrobiales bacterium]
RAWRGGGLAAALLDAALAWARAAGFRDVYLGTTGGMAAAHRFYEKHGFRRVEKAQLPDDFIFVPVDTTFFMRAL